MFLSCADFFKSTFSKNSFQEYHKRVKQVGSRSGPTFVGPDLGPNCLQMLSADDTSRQKAKLIYYDACTAPPSSAKKISVFYKEKLLGQQNFRH